LIPFYNVDYVTKFNRSFNDKMKTIVHMKTGKSMELDQDDVGRFDHEFLSWLDLDEKAS